MTSSSLSIQNPIMSLQSLADEAAQTVEARANEHLRRISNMYLLSVRDVARENPELAARQFGMTVSLAKSIASCDPSHLENLISSGALAFKFNGSEQAASAVLDDPNARNIVSLLGSRF